MKISVMITTRNRCEELRDTLSILRDMVAPPDEVLVCADACTDQTELLVESEFPTVRLFSNSHQRGSVASRHRLLLEATGDWVLSLDDDSHPIDKDFFLRIQGVIDSHPESAVITFPELRNSGEYADAKMTQNSPGHYVAAYANCAAIMDRAFYFKQPGFPPIFEHMYEEPDYALQCYAAGSSVWFEPSLIIRHLVSQNQRNNLRRHHLGARNELWSVWLRCPWPYLPFVSLFRILRQFQYAVSEGHLWTFREPTWWRASFAGLRFARTNRNPVPWVRYFAWMKLSRVPIATPDVLQREFRF